jgi:hypothetical protein
MDFWDIIWFIIVSFAFFAYLLILFNILGDLFRDHETSGWLKAVWVIFLIFVPFLTALVYLIARGHGMAERQMAAMAKVKESQDAYIQSVAGGSSAADQISKGKELLDSGTITQAEFDALKAKALGA